MWIVLRYENDYDQYGGYFVSVHPTEDECVSPNGHFGRLDYENTWYVKLRAELNTEYSNYGICRAAVADPTDPTF